MDCVTGNHFSTSLTQLGNFFLFSAHRSQSYLALIVCCFWFSFGCWHLSDGLYHREKGYFATEIHSLRLCDISPGRWDKLWPEAESVQVKDNLKTLCQRKMFFFTWLLYYMVRTITMTSRKQQIMSEFTVILCELKYV